MFLLLNFILLLIVHFILLSSVYILNVSSLHISNPTLPYTDFRNIIFLCLKNIEPFRTGWVPVACQNQLGLTWMHSLQLIWYDLGKHQWIRANHVKIRTIYEKYSYCIFLILQSCTKSNVVWNEEIRRGWHLSFTFPLLHFIAVYVQHQPLWA